MKDKGNNPQRNLKGIDLGQNRGKKKRSTWWHHKRIERQCTNLSQVPNWTNGMAPNQMQYRSNQIQQRRKRHPIELNKGSALPLKGKQRKTRRQLSQSTDQIEVPKRIKTLSLKEDQVAKIIKEEWYILPSEDPIESKSAQSKISAKKEIDKG